MLGSAINCQKSVWKIPPEYSISTSDLSEYRKKVFHNTISCNNYNDIDENIKKGNEKKIVFMLNKIVSSVLCWVHYAVIIIHKNFLKQNGFGFFSVAPKNGSTNTNSKECPNTNLTNYSILFCVRFFPLVKICSIFVFALKKFIFYSICVFHEEKKHFIKRDLVSEQR